MGRNGVITLATLARRLNVTTTTVSKALHGKPGIGAEMVRKVQALARELNYQPNVVAQSLQKNASDAIGLLISSDITVPWYAQLVSSIEQELSCRGKTMVLSLGKNDELKERQCLDAFLGGRVGGVIVGPIFRRRNLSNVWQFMDSGLPMVLFNCMDEMPVSYVSVNQARGACLAVEHLIACGHRRIGYLCCPSNDMEEVGKTRRQGYEAALLGHDLPVLGRDIVEMRPTKEGGYLVMRELLTESRSCLPTAFFCHNDHVALGAIMAIHEAGYSVPRDFSVIGFDDIEESSWSIPHLTTVGNIRGRLASELVEVLLEKIRGGGSELVQRELEPELVLRDSVASV